MSYTFSFEKLTVWKDSIELIKSIYSITKNFPDDEKFGLKSQIRRASISVASNISEGTSRISNKDKSHFTTIAFSSLMEVLNQLIIAKELNYIVDDDYYKIRMCIEMISNKLNALKKSQLNN